MAILTDEKGNIFDFALLDAPLTHSLIVVKCQDGFLFMHNKWSNNWELPGGVIEMEKLLGNVLSGNYLKKPIKKSRLLNSRV
nr:hypothetical protein [Paenibacillus lignilyticus]